MFEKLKSLFQKKSRKNPPIEIFVRHCHYSSASPHKNRFPHFSKKKCFDNLIETLYGVQEDRAQLLDSIDKSSVHVTFFLDTFHPEEATHFLKEQTVFPVVEIKAGTEAQSFLAMLEHVSRQKFKPDSIVYFLEDDYLHRPGWIDVLKEGFTLEGVEYVTLFDHRDKYFLPQYASLQSKIYHTRSCHWRTTPSTTNTYAMRFKTLKRDLEIHQAFSLDRQITADHDKFCHLRKLGALLISSIPGYSTHVEVEFASPCVDWHQF